MTTSTLRVIAPPDWPDEDVAGALEEILKSLANPAPSIERARARAAFGRLQNRFTKQVTLIYEQVDQVSVTRRQMKAEGGVDLAAMADLQLQTHRRAIAQLNRQFAQAYETAFLYGLTGGGAARQLTDDEREMVRRLRINENAYAANFLTDIVHGEGTMDYGRRAAMYGNALEEVYWQGYLYADQSADRFVRWRMQHGVGFEDPENCKDCARLSGNLAAFEPAEGDTDAQAERKRTALALIEGSGLPVGGRWGNGVYQARELAAMAVAPQSGKLECTTHCHCALEPAEKPAGKPHGKAERAFRSLEPKSFTGTERNEQGRPVVTREHAQPRRKRLATKADRTDHVHVPRGHR